MRRQFVFIFTAVLLLGACSTLQKSDSSLMLKLDDLTQDMAAERAANIKNVSYDLSLQVSKDKTLFSGEQKIIFDLREVKDVYFDFQGGDILRSVVNGAEITLDRGPVFVRIPKSLLRHERNMVIVRFQHEHSRTGTGFHRFTDPEDQSVYLYTDFQPFDASEMAPFFDQPDIKATFALTVEAPSDWQVISNGRILSAKATAAGDVKKWQFLRTPAMSTYLYAVMAGPYVYRESSYGKKPMRIYSRKTMAQYIPYEEWFRVTRQGLKFYEDFFQINYPYGKYDQIVVPEFGSGAMENAGAITFTERYVKRGGMNRRDKVYLYNIVLHEMAHQWFGNLVTMKWWDDLWLNESFATFMAPLAQEKSTEFKEAWQFFRTDKVTAYRQDQSSTTHPIAAPVGNTNEAYSNFDDITYGKGAAVIQQMYFYLGAEEFKKGIRDYFKTHANQNTELKDFIAAFERTSKEDLKPWFNTWLKTTGVDQVKPSYLCEKGKVTVQIENMNVDPRPQAFRVAFIKSQAGGIKVSRFIEIKRRPQDLINKVATAEVISSECPDFIYANYGDYGYFELHYDDKDILFLEKNLNRIEDPLLRQGIWSDLWELVRDQRLSLQKFSDMALINLKTETDYEILDFLAEKTIGQGGYGEFASVYYYWPKSTPDEKAKYNEMANKYEQVFHERLKSLTSQSGLYRFFATAWMNAVESKAGLQNIAAEMQKFKDPDLRWKALLTLCSEDFANVDSLVAAELTGDKSDVAQKNALTCQVKKPSEQNKKQWLAKLTTDKIALSADEVNRVATNLFYGSKRERMAPYVGDILSATKGKWEKLDESYQSRLVGGLAPIYCNPAAHEKLATFLASNKGLPSSLRTPLQEKLDDDKVCLAVRGRMVNGQ